MPSTRTMVAALACALPFAAIGSAHAAPTPPSTEFYGITSATDLSEAESATMARGGVRLLRVPFFWPHFEKEPPADSPLPVAPPVDEPDLGLPSPADDDGVRFWHTDKIVERAAADGIRVLPFVYGTPGWLADDPMSPPIRSAEQRREWRRFLGELVGRYGPGGEFWQERSLTRPELPEVPITSWQVWNEQNSRVFWSPAPAADQYARLVALASSAIRGVDPEATVVLGGMFATPTRGIRAAAFLRRLHRSGHAAGAFDAYALHPYSPNLRGLVRQVRHARRALRRVDALALPLWVTEIGWPTAGRKSFPLVKTSAGQKRMLARSYRLLLRRSERWNVERLLWYTWRDNDVTPGCIVCRHSGLFDRRFEPKPAWRKLTQLAGGAP